MDEDGTIPGYCFFCRRKLPERRSYPENTMTFFYDWCSDCKAKKDAMIAARQAERNATDKE